MTITKPNGETTVTTVRIWNETVSNLTLMALGSSAPEILLSVIEVQNIHIYILTSLTDNIKNCGVTLTQNINILRHI